MDMMAHQSKNELVQPNGFEDPRDALTPCSQSGRSLPCEGEQRLKFSGFGHGGTRTRCARRL